MRATGAGRGPPSSGTAGPKAIAAWFDAPALSWSVLRAPGPNAIASGAAAAGRLSALCRISDLVTMVTARRAALGYPKNLATTARPFCALHRRADL